MVCVFNIYTYVYTYMHFQAINLRKSFQILLSESVYKKTATAICEVVPCKLKCISKVGETCVNAVAGFLSHVPLPSSCSGNLDGETRSSRK